MKILIAEDDPVSRRLLEALLVKWGHEVVVVCDGEEAWSVLQMDDSPKMAILDWMMPKMDGLQVCSNVRQRSNTPYVYVMLLTAKSHKQDVQAGLEAGADDYITKPFDANELQARIYAGKRVIELEAALISTRECLRLQATHDPLTGLPNRLLFSDRLTQCISHAKRNIQKLAVIYLDLDRFKLINDTLGHNQGDELLKAVSERLKGCLRKSDTLARMGGDEFTIILPETESDDDAVKVSENVLDALSEGFMLCNREVFISASIGISLFPADGEDVETLVKNADSAMYMAKEQGKNNYHIYTDSLHSATMERMTLENDLRRALERDEFIVYYQPLVNIENSTIVGAEALVRWMHPKFGMVSPVDFIHIAEETGLISPISNWVMHQACKQTRKWHESGLPPLSIAVNVSARQFQQCNLMETVTDILKSTGLNPNYLDIEITESTLMENPDSAISILSDLKAMGIKISIDDFGTGYSSLSYLRKFPIDTVKIDRSFIGEITTNPDDAAIAGAVVAMSKSLRLKVIAEGVETLEQLEFLRSIQCDQMQGYFVSPPVPAESFENLVRERLANSKDLFSKAA